MKPPYTIDGHKMAVRVPLASAVPVIAARKRWLCWPLCVVSEELLATHEHALPLAGMLKERLSLEDVSPAVYREQIFHAVTAPGCEDPDVLSVVGIPWWAVPVAKAGNTNRVVLLNGHPLVVVAVDGRAVALIASSRRGQRSGPPRMSDWPTHDIHGRPWGTGSDPMGLRITTPFDGGAA